jgi:simple sugar transport system substrate-binding protein
MSGIRKWAIRAAAILAVLASAVMAANAADPVKVGFVYVGSIGDFGWTYQHDVGRRAIEAKFGDRVKTTYVESVNEGSDAERVIRELAVSGHQIIFTTSFGFGTATLKVASQFPDVKFEHATGHQRAANVSTYAARFYEGRAVIGKIAGRVTRSNTIGYIASHPIPEVIRGINAFTLAMQSVNPKASVKIVWISAWYDPAKEADAAQVLIDQGADIIVQHTDSAAPLQIAEAAGVHGFGQATDMTQFAPKAQLTSIVDSWDSYYIARVQAVIDGTWTSQDTWGGFDSGMVVLAPYNTSVLSEDIITEAKSTAASITSGAVHPFTGPIHHQDGTLKVKAGENLTEDASRGMDWYVQGIEGEIPN